MKLSRVYIKNLRQIKELELSFENSLGVVNDTTLIVGPNGSGKTTILDAIALCIGPSVYFPVVRPSLSLTPRTIVRKGAIAAQVDCEFIFSAEEIKSTQTLFELMGEKMWKPKSDRVVTSWTYPDTDIKWGRVNYSSSNASDPNLWRLFRGRSYAAKLISTGSLPKENGSAWNWFREVGSAFMFDQQRQGFEKTISREILEIIRGVPIQQTDDRITSSPKEILLNIAIEDTLPTPKTIKNSAHPQSKFKLVQEAYARVCSPRKIVGIERGDDGVDLIFSDGNHQYTYEGMSSGEQLVLLFLIRMVTDYINQSIVLIDEIELHQHPIWQTRILDTLERVGVNNQIIATTHSAYLRDSVSPGSIKNIGSLE